jgi:hypothetical protein
MPEQTYRTQTVPDPFLRNMKEFVRGNPQLVSTLLGTGAGGIAAHFLQSDDGRSLLKTLLGGAAGGTAGYLVPELVEYIRQDPEEAVKAVLEMREQQVEPGNPFIENLPEDVKAGGRFTRDLGSAVGQSDNPFVKLVAASPALLALKKKSLFPAAGGALAGGVAREIFTDTPLHNTFSEDLPFMAGGAATGVALQNRARIGSAVKRILEALGKAKAKAAPAAARAGQALKTLRKVK